MNQTPPFWRPLASLILILLSSCAAPPPQQQELAPLVFPPPPEPPRFVFERMLVSSSQIKQQDKESRLRIMLTGEVDTGVGFSKPFDVIACQGTIYVSDTIQRLVLAFDVPNGRFFEIGDEEPGALVKPLGLAVDDDCNLYVADITAKRVVVYDQAGGFLRAIGGSEWFERLSHIAVTPDGSYLFAVDTGGVDSPNHWIRVFDALSGEHLRNISRRGSEPGKLNLPRDIDIGPDGLLYVIDGGNFRVQVFQQDGTFVRSFGSAGRQFGQFARPKGLAVDLQGNVYISDTSHGNFQIFDPQGQLLLFVGDRGGELERARYMLPAGLDVDEDGRVYMVDQFHRKVDIYRPASLQENEGYLGAWATP